MGTRRRRITGRGGGRLTDDQIAPRSQQLYDEGARKLADAWDEAPGLIRHETPFGVFHDGRGSLAYAGVLLREGGARSIDRAERIIRTVAKMQEQRPQDAHYGNFRWFFEDAVVTDLNAVEFVLDGLNHLIRAFPDKLSERSRDVILEMIRLGLDEIDRLDVHPSYTNIMLSDVCNTILGGEALDAPEYNVRGALRLEQWLAFTNQNGAPHEYNSPTYLAVDLMRMAFLAEHTKDDFVALKARIAEERLWLHVAAHYHPMLAQLAGPHSRSYRDGWTGAGGYLKLILWKLLGDDTLRRPTPYYPKGREEGHIGVADATFHCPQYVLDWLRSKRYPFEALEAADERNGNDLTTYMTETYALGTAARSYGVGEPPEYWQQPNSMLLHFKRDGDPAYGVMYARYVINDKGPGATMHESNRTAEDFWDEGRFVGAQHRNVAIIAYGLMPRVRPTESYKLSLRVLDNATSDVWVNGRKVDQFPLKIDPGATVVLDAGQVYIGIFPLRPTDMGSDAPIELSRTDQEFVLDIYNYRGPAKSFWEHRSQGGPFYRGNVQNAVIVEVGDPFDFDGVSAFARRIAEAFVGESIDDLHDGPVREIAYSSGGSSLSLRYSLRDMSVVERKHDGITYTPPLGRVGATDGRGPQWRQSCDSLIELGDAKLMSDRTPTWLYAEPDEAGGRYVVVNPTDVPAPVWLHTPRTVIDCEEVGFGRIELDERASTITIETLDALGPVLIRGASNLRLIVNGEDVTQTLSPASHDGTREFGGLEADTPDYM